MHDSFRSRVKAAIIRYALVDADETVLVAISGGADSVALLLALCELRSDLGFQLYAAHFNHHLRGSESERDERFVRRLAEQLNVSLRTGHFKGDRSAPPGEAKLRQERYAFLRAQARQIHAIIATGHTLNDQAETVLLRLFRGAGARGLSGIAPSTWTGVERPLKLIRPMLDVSRAEVEAFLQEENQEYREDSSNRDLTFDRNWLRHELMPMLRQRLNPRLDEAIARTASMNRDIVTFLERQASAWIAREGVSNEGGPGENRISLPASRMAQLPRPVSREVIRGATRRVLEGRNPLSMEHVDTVLKFREAPSGKELDLPGGLRVLREFDKLVFSTETSRLRPFEYQLSVPGRQEIRELGKIVVLSREPLPDSMAWIELSSKKVRVRSRHPGDSYFSPNGKRLKLKELFRQARIPFSQRDKLVLIEQKEEIKFVEALPVPDQLQADPGQPNSFCVSVRTNETFHGG